MNHGTGVFCQGCGLDYDFFLHYEGLGGESLEHKDCLITDLVSADSDLIHLLQGLNTIIIGEQLSIMSSNSKYLIYEL